MKMIIWGQLFFLLSYCFGRAERESNLFQAFLVRPFVKKKKVEELH